MMKRLSGFLLATVTVATLAGPTIAGDTIRIDGAGATFPCPIYSKWFAEYNRLHPNVQIDCQSIGSGTRGRVGCTNQPWGFRADSSSGSASPGAGGRARGEGQTP